MRFGLLIAVFLFSLSRAAGAEPHSNEPRIQSERQWYGPPVLMVYGAGYSAIALGLLGSDAKPQAVRSVATVLLFSGAGTALIGVPIVHWSHDEVGKGFASLGGQLGAFGTGSLVGYLVAKDKGTGALVGGAIGHASFALADAFLLAHHERVLSVEFTTGKLWLEPYGLGGALGGAF